MNPQEIDGDDPVVTQVSRRHFLALSAYGVTASSLALTSCSDDPPRPQQKFLDIHRHVTQGTLTSDAPDDLDDVIEWMDKWGIAQAIIPMAVWVEAEDSIDRDQALKVLDNIRRYRQRLFPMCSIHPLSLDSHTDQVQFLSELKQQGVVGFGELKPGNDLMINDPKCIALYRACAEAKLPVLFHTDSDNCIDDPGLPHLESVLQACPDTQFLAHGPGWWASISGDISTRDELNGYHDGEVVAGGAVPRLLEKYPNLYGDLSAKSGLNAIERDLPHGIDFLTRFQDKLVFGTDKIPVPFFEWGHVDFYNALTLPENVTNKIFRENAQRIFGLPNFPE